MCEKNAACNRNTCTQRKKCNSIKQRQRKAEVRRNSKKEMGNRYAGFYEIWTYVSDQQIAYYVDVGRKPLVNSSSSYEWNQPVMCHYHIFKCNLQFLTFSIFWDLWILYFLFSDVNCSFWLYSLKAIHFPCATLLMGLLSSVKEKLFRLLKNVIFCGRQKIKIWNFHMKFRKN